MASKNTESALDDSWVVSELDESAVIVQEDESAPTASLSSERLTPASSYSESELIREYQDTTDAVSSSTTNLPDLTDSTATLALSTTSSGPELIMPSIMFDSRTSDNGSWVIPRKRSKQSLYESRKAPRLPKPSRSHASAHEHDAYHEQQQKNKLSSNAAAADAVSNMSVSDYFAQILNNPWGNIQPYEFFRLLLNALLVLMVMHLLIFPELVHQAPAACQVSLVSKIYSQTCAGHNRNISEIPSYSANFQSAVRTQNQLQIYLNQTIDEMTPVDSSLKDSDTILRGVYTDIRKEYGSARHEVELEFEGVWAASRAIARAVTNLRIDIKATVDGFRMPTHRVESVINGGKGGTNDRTSSSIFNRLMPSRRLSESDKQEANIVAAMNQFGRLTQELDSAIARLARKTDTLLVQLGKLDDHLQSIRNLIIREQYRLNPHHSADGDPKHQVETVWTSLSSFIHRSSKSSGHTGQEDEPENRILTDLERIASYHDLMADVVGKLDRELKALQRIRAIRT